MVSVQNLELELQSLFKEKKFSEIIFEITTKSKEDERNAGLFVLLGISRISLNKKNKDQVELAVGDFKKGYLKELTSENSLNGLINFVLASVILSDFENTNVDFDEIKNFYKASPETFQNKRPINIAMTTVYSRLNDFKGMVYHLEKVIKSGDFISNDLCNYGFWRCYDKRWSQENFFDYGKFVEKNLNKYSDNQIIELSNKKNEKIKLGILSADLKTGHSITFFLKTILLHYNRDEIEIYLISNQKDPTTISTEISNLVSRTIDINQLNDLSALNKIRELNLDIMIDVMGYTSRNRIALFKNRIAKKQIIWMGYCNTTGLKNMDYIITDPNLIYDNEKDLYAEQILYMPEIWNTHCGFEFERIENPPPFIKNDYITFGSFNNPSKINEDVIDCWSKILKNIDNSKLIIKCPNDKHQLNRIKKSFKEKFILQSIIFHTSFDDKKDHLNLYKKIDIALDTFPYNAHTSCSDSIWAGVPVLTKWTETIDANWEMRISELIFTTEDDLSSYLTRTVGGHISYGRLCAESKNFMKSKERHEDFAEIMSKEIESLSA